MPASKAAASSFSRALEMPEQGAPADSAGLGQLIHGGVEAVLQHQCAGGRGDVVDDGLALGLREGIGGGHPVSLALDTHECQV